MTQENKSAADVATEIMDAIHCGASNSDVIELITQAIQSETAALLASNVELTAEVITLRRLYKNISLKEGCLYHVYDPDKFCGEWPELKEALSQTSPTGFGDKALKFAWNGFKAHKVREAYIHIGTVANYPGPIDNKAVAQAEKEYNDALLDLWDDWSIEQKEELTPEEIKLLEGYGDEN